MKKSFPVVGFLCISFVFSGVVLAAGCSGKTSGAPVTRTGFAFDTVVSVTIYDTQKEDALDACLELCEKYENLFSATREGSEVWNINHADGKAVAVSYDTASLIQSALFYCAESRGLLDLTLGPVSGEWDIAGQMKQAAQNADYAYYIPSDRTLTELMEHVNYQNVVVTDENGLEIGYSDVLSAEKSYYVTLKDGQSAIDLGFIAKGYIADCLKTYLLSEGVESGIISLGGNILLIGSKPDGSPFHVGIRKPFGAANEVITTVRESDLSVVSSGCYERYFISGTVCHHILDTATGRPVQNDLLGVTILSGSSLQGDALSTYCYVLGLEKGLAYVRSLENVEAVFVTADYEVIASSDDRTLSKNASASPCPQP